ncbi:GIY-YIG nuclease family protein [Patescibacteria group bacterium]
MRDYYVYILVSKKNGRLYIGVTNNLIRRIFEHKQGKISSFTKRYKIYSLVYYEQANDISIAISREKQIKKWKRQWKVNLINQFNSQWIDLYFRICN